MLRSAGAVLLGFLSVAVLSLATDQVLHVLNVYPPWGEPMWEPSLNFLALSYRLVYTVLGGYITASLAPHSSMRHVAVVGILGTIAGTAGAVAAITAADLGPNWYPIALAVTRVSVCLARGRASRPETSRSLARWSSVMAPRAPPPARSRRDARA